MKDDDEYEFSVSDVLRLYAEGRRDFRHATIGPENETFANKDLDGADFSFSVVDTVFFGASLRGARFLNANVKACVFDCADLSKASFEGAAIDSATFRRADISGATFASATSHSHEFVAGETPDGALDEGSVSRHERFRRALSSPTLSAALHAFATELRNEGETQRDVEGLFDLFRAKHARDPDETFYDAILDAMDFIVGFCSPGAAIFEDPQSKC